MDVLRAAHPRAQYRRRVFLAGAGQGRSRIATAPLDDWMEEGYRALRVMENHLQNRRYFAADRYTIADIALYAYTHLAHTCDFDLTAFPAVRAWLDRMAEQPGHVLMDEQPSA